MEPNGTGYGRIAPAEAFHAQVDEVGGSHATLLPGTDTRQLERSGFRQNTLAERVRSVCGMVYGCIVKSVSCVTHTVDGLGLRCPFP